MRVAIFVMICGALAIADGANGADEALPGDGPPRDPYVLDWWSLDGGGGPSAGGGFDVFGTIGQPDAGRAAGGRFLVTGGFLAGSDSRLVFTDGFEVGNTSSWSTATGGSKLGGGE